MLTTYRQHDGIAGYTLKAISIDFKNGSPQKEKPLIFMQDFRPALDAYLKFTVSQDKKEGMQQVFNLINANDRWC